MGRMGDFFGGIFGKGQDTSGEDRPVPGMAKGSAESDKAQPSLGGHYQPGDFIGGKYEVGRTLGIGGFGIVYLVRSRETGHVVALKTFRDEYLEDAQTREQFRREAQVWVKLDVHPYLVRAYIVEEISGRLYIVMEYVAPDEEGLNSLDGYLQRRPPDLAQSLRWAIQFCYGMEYAYAKGIRCHRDIKPGNIMIGQDKTVKISDFGLAGILGTARGIEATGLSVPKGRIGLSAQTAGGAVFGTPTHMPPEQFSDAASCDQRSDIYSFGVVLYQMATGGQVPFLAPLPRDSSPEEQARFWRRMHQLHGESTVPKLDSPLFPMIERCLEKEPGKRYSGFAGLRGDLEPILRRMTGEVVRPPALTELEASEWSNKGNSLDTLGRYDEAIRCYDKAIEINPRHANAWINRGVSLEALSRHDEAIQCFDKAIEIDPRNAMVWIDKGASLGSLGRYEESNRCCDKAIEIDPQYALAWNNKGYSLACLGRYDEAIRCYDKALKIDPRDARAWVNMGNSLSSLGRVSEAIRCYDKALEIDPRNAEVWSIKGSCLNSLGRFAEATQCCDKALRIDPRNAKTWNIKGFSLKLLGRYEEAIRCYDKALEITPRYAMALINKGICLKALERYDEASRCCDKALDIDPRNELTWYTKGFSVRLLGRYEEAIYCCDKALEIDPKFAEAWHDKALAEDELGRARNAARSYREFIEIAPPQYEQQIGRARQRLKELE